MIKSLLNTSLNINYGMNNIIAEELTIIFDFRIEAASRYLFQSAQNTKNYSIDSLKEFFVLQKDIEEVIYKIRTRLYRELGMEEELPELTISVAADHYEKVLSPLLKQYRITSFITSVSENLIDDSLSSIPGSLYSSNILEFAIGNIGTGAWLLAGNSKKNQTKRIQNNIYNHLKGMLMNLRIQVENEMMDQWADYDTMEDGIAV